MKKLGYLLLLCPLVLKAQQHKDPRLLVQIRKMTLPEKISLLHGNSLFGTAGIPRFGIPPLKLDDGPLGVREEVNPDWTPAGLKTDSATFFPNGSALAATWDIQLSCRYGRALGEEARARHKDVILAPAVNLARTPLGGRTYEYLSEDPWLNARLVVPLVQGIQSAGVAACVKHFALNNQEQDRTKVNVEVSERALQELYLPAFKAAVTEGKSWTIMSAYNRVRGQYCAENAYLLQTILRKKWGFKGVVISDWNGTHSTLASAKNGLDLEMGTDGPFEKYYFAEPLLAAVRNGEISEKLIDEKVYRLLWLRQQTQKKTANTGALNSKAHLQTTYDIAAGSAVLLKNKNNLLPLGRYSRLAVIGANAVQLFQRGGFGAGVKAKTEISLLQGLRQRLGSASIHYAAGYSTTDTQRVHRCALINEATALAAESDAVIVCIGGNRDYESENRDRTTLALPYGVDELASAVKKANQNTIIVVLGGAPYDLNRLDTEQDAIIWAGYGGSLGGLALADLLTGKVCPSGKLPFTFPRKLEDSPAHALGAYPGDSLNEIYKEDMLVGYRWFNTKKINPLYPFGYGLSYTRFDYGPLAIRRNGSAYVISFRLCNTGPFSGKEVVQLYLRKKGSIVTRPAEELKAFAKITLAAGRSRTVILKMSRQSLAYYDEKRHSWRVEPGQYQLLAGSSSTDFRQQKTLMVK